MKPYHKNPRTLSTKQATALKRDLEELGDLSGIVHDLNSDEIIGGNQRSRVMEVRPEMVTVLQRFEPPTRTGTAAIGHIDYLGERYHYRAVRWTAKQCEKANIVANKGGGSWDLGVLAESFEVADLREWGFEEAELPTISPATGATDADAVPEAPETPRTRVGDMWLLGEHRVLCGNSADHDVVIKVMGGDLAQCVFTDPPYGVSIGKKNVMLNSFQKAGRNLADIVDDDLSPDQLLKALAPVFAEIKNTVMAEDCTVFVCSPQGGGLGMMMMMMMMMKEYCYEARHVLIWKKNCPTFSMGRLDYDYQHEPILLTWGKRHKRPMLGAHKTSVWEVDKPRENKAHPTMKPVELYINGFLNNSDPGDVVFDPYCGSGTCIIAAEQTGRLARGIEISPHYCDVIVKRWMEFTGKEAVREDGVFWSDVS